MKSKQSNPEYELIYKWDKKGDNNELIMGTFLYLVSLIFIIESILTADGLLAGFFIATQFIFLISGLILIINSSSEGKRTILRRIK